MCNLSREIINTRLLDVQSEHLGVELKMSFAGHQGAALSQKKPFQLPFLAAI